MTETGIITYCGSLIELLAAFVVAWHAALALWSLLRDHSGDRARVLIAGGVLDALGFSVAGTLLKTIGLQSWQEIRMFAFVLVLRTVLKRIFQWERRAILSRRTPART